ncbi:MAG TPA: hypothetical protein VNN20_03180 [Thermodesulfobacteriota bacterium]|nr:hypothetical protein [Thermodesulfobacteriota bacterium]
MTEMLRLKGPEKGTKKNKEALHDMVMRRLARYVENEVEDTLTIPNAELKHRDDEEEFEEM